MEKSDEYIYAIAQSVLLLLIVIGTVNTVISDSYIGASVAILGGLVMFTLQGRQDGK